MNQVQKGETHLFSYESPQKLKYLLQKKRDELNRKEERVDEIIENLKKTIAPEAVMPKVQFFD